VAVIALSMVWLGFSFGSHGRGKVKDQVTFRPFLDMGLVVTILGR